MLGKVDTLKQDYSHFRRFPIDVFNRLFATQNAWPQGGREGGTSPPFENPPPPLLNQHKYYNKVVLKHKQQQMYSSKKGMHLFKDTYNFSEGVLNIGNRHCFLVCVCGGGGGGGTSDGFHPLYETLPPDCKVMG